MIRKSVRGLVGRVAVLRLRGTNQLGEPGAEILVRGVVKSACATKDCRGNDVVQVVLDEDGRSWFCQPSELDFE